MCCPGTACSNGEGRRGPGGGGQEGKGREGGERRTPRLTAVPPTGLCTPPESPPGAAELDETGAEALPRRTPAPAWLPARKGKRKGGAPGGGGRRWWERFPKGSGAPRRRSAP